MSEPPRENNFKAHLEWHLFENGTRPDRRPRRWSVREFGDALQAIRDKMPTSKDAKGDGCRSLRDWLRGKKCTDLWGFAVERALFGEPGNYELYETWRKSLHEARTARPQEALRASTYVSEPSPYARATEVRTIEELSRQGWNVHRAGAGTGCTNPVFNEELVVCRPMLRINGLPDPWLANERYHPDLEGFILAEVERKKKDGSIYFNDDKIRIASDFIGKLSVDLQKTDYLSSLMTDQLRWNQVRSKSLDDQHRPERLLRSLDSFVDPRTGFLKGFAENSVSNQLGASTLALSKDGYLMITIQNGANFQSRFHLAPTGSGSLDWRDVEASCAADLISLVEYGAQRELQEECGLDHDGGGELIASKVIAMAFARMLHRAGKPEFYCLGYIHARATEIMQRKPDRYTDRVIRPEVGRVDLDSAHPTIDIARICGSYLDKENELPMSYPLEHGLQLLLAACENERSAKIIDSWCQQTQV
jgi:hypothetical protein